jgi:hypothetical protein
MRRQAERQRAERAPGVIRHSWFFVLHLSANQQRDSGYSYEAQSLDDDGKAVEVARYTSFDEGTMLAGKLVPHGVLHAASELPEGQGCFVDATGWEVTPMGVRLDPNAARTTGGQPR